MNFLFSYPAKVNINPFPMPSKISLLGFRINRIDFFFGKILVSTAILFLFCPELTFSNSTGPKNRYKKGKYTGKPYSVQILTKLSGIQKAENSIRVLRNSDGLLPLRNPQEKKIALIQVQSLGEEALNRTIFNTLSHYAQLDSFQIGKVESPELVESLKERIKTYNQQLVEIHGKTINSLTLGLLDKINNPNLILIIHAPKQTLSLFRNFSHIIWSDEVNEFTEQKSAEIIMGAGVPKGIKNTEGNSFAKLGRVSRVIPEEIGLDSRILDRVDSIALEAIKKKAFPGCVILAMKDGKIFYEKSFGTHTYTDNSPTRTNDVFDLASVTKISSTLPAVMKAYEQGLISLESPLSTYLPETRNTNKKDIRLIDLLTHQAGLVPFIPFYVQAIKENGVFSRDSNSLYSWRVADKMFERNNYFSEVMWPKILESPVKAPGKFVYSDLSMYFMRAVFEKVSHEDLKTYVTQVFYKPLGLTTMGFNPREKIPLNRLIPTEEDTLFRKQLLIGDVHDQGAAMQNGIAGHAGLFSDAQDLAVLGQLYLNEGTYGGRMYFRPETFRLFNKRPFPKTNRRALGFDKPDLNPEKYTSVPAMASSDTFGHTGFTGTCIWVDPKEKLVYVFLSNRVCPDAGNNKITEWSIRPKINTVFYEALKLAR